MILEIAAGIILAVLILSFFIIFFRQVVLFAIILLLGAVIYIGWLFLNDVGWLDIFKYGILFCLILTVVAAFFIKKPAIGIALIIPVFGYMMLIDTDFSFDNGVQPILELALMAGLIGIILVLGWLLDYWRAKRMRIDEALDEENSENGI